MGPGYQLETLSPPAERNESLFPFMIQRNFDTEMEKAGAPVFYFLEREEALECLDTLLSH